jgi:hypothetical protein
VREGRGDGARFVVEARQKARLDDISLLGHLGKQPVPTVREANFSGQTSTLPV